jgi:2-polyprenyl-6-methoxyphenol hydroxylase-like FAD-dependent oxidoreductase
VHGVDALYAPRRTVLDPILVDAAREAGATVTFGRTITELLTTSDGRVTGVAGRDQSGQPFTVRAPLTIGADGIRSRVATMTSAPVERRSTFATGVLYAHVAGMCSDAYEWHYVPELAAGVIPTNHGASCVFVAARPPRMREALASGPAHAFSSLLAGTSRSLAARVADAGGVSRFRSFPGTQGYMKRPWGPGWALVGDAGYFKDPISAHGISDALRDAELVARATADVLGGATSEHLAMMNYARTRDRVSSGLFATTDAIASFNWDTPAIEQLLRTLSASATDELELIDSFDTVLAGTRRTA